MKIGIALDKIGFGSLIKCITNNIVPTSSESRNPEK